MPRKSAKELASISGRANLDAIHMLANEAKELGEGTRDYRATFLRNESECKRWIRQIEANGDSAPDYIKRNFPTWSR